MLATLCSYEGCFGPYHPNTLHLMVHAGIAHWQAGEVEFARPLLERAIRDLGRCFDRCYPLRTQAIQCLRDVCSAQGDYQRAASAQKELLECQSRQLGADHPETIRARAVLAGMLLDNFAQSSAAS